MAPAMILRESADYPHTLAARQGPGGNVSAGFRAFPSENTPIL
jgi:hypothetical protein